MTSKSNISFQLNPYNCGDDAIKYRFIYLWFIFRCAFHTPIHFHSINVRWFFDVCHFHIIFSLLLMKNALRLMNGMNKILAQNLQHFHFSSVEKVIFAIFIFFFSVLFVFSTYHLSMYIKYINCIYFIIYDVCFLFSTYCNGKLTSFVYRCSWCCCLLFFYIVFFFFILLKHNTTIIEFSFSKNVIFSSFLGFIFFEFLYCFLNIIFTMCIYISIYFIDLRYIHMCYIVSAACIIVMELIELLFKLYSGC